MDRSTRWELVACVTRWARKMLVDALSNHGRYLRESDRECINHAVLELGNFGVPPTAIHGNPTNVKHEGKATYRLADNPEEERFASAWFDQNRLCHTLEYMLGNGSTRCEITQRDATLAATIIQWLGSSVGQAFLKDLGYVRVEDPDE